MEKKYYDTFGHLAPLLSSLLGLLFLIFVIWAIGNMGEELGTAAFESVSEFLMDYLLIFFGLMLFFNYSSYVNREFGGYFSWIHPFISSVGVVIFLWFLAEVFIVFDGETDIGLIAGLARWVQVNLLIIFALVVLLSYIKRLSWTGARHERERIATEYHEDYPGGETSDVKRLYRSGRDKLLGGVCGGIGDHLNIDPVIIRIIWVVGAFASFGTAVILYMILWILIPRDPRDRWE